MSESALLRATRDEIRAHADFRDREVQVEVAEQAPATVGDRFVIVTFGTVATGPAHNPSAKIIDKIYGINVSLALRATKKPRDRTRDLWVALTKSFETYRRSIESKIDFSYTLLDAANVFILAEESSSEGFIEPLKVADPGPIRQAPAEIFAGTSGETAAALIRTFPFRGARRIVTRS